MRITLSKSQWEEIGKKTGWIKTAESTPNINNLTYYEDRETGVELELGGEYDINTGRCKIDKIVRDPVNMKVMVTATTIGGDKGGQQFSLEASRLAKMHKNLQPKAINPNYNFRNFVVNSPNEYPMLAYIAKHGKITVQSPNSQSKHVSDQYMEMTGDMTRNNPNFSEANDSSKWHTQFRIYLPKDARKYHGQLSTLYNAIETKAGMQISGALISGLFKYGFKLGNNAANIDIIRNNLCQGDQSKEAKFNSGLEM